jgi:hypothetical protein
MSFDLAKERFTTLKKKVSAFGSGVKLATEVEKVKGDFLTTSIKGKRISRKILRLVSATTRQLPTLKKLFMTLNQWMRSLSSQGLRLRWLPCKLRRIERIE